MTARDVITSAREAHKRGMPSGTVFAYISHSTGHVKYKELADDAWDKVRIRGGRYYKHSDKKSRSKKRSRRAAKA
jgi:hypothetical protein